MAGGISIEEFIARDISFDENNPSHFVEAKRPVLDLPLPGTATSPVPFECSDGHIYWLKASPPGGIARELIAGRLADRVGVGPIARVVLVKQESIEPHDGDTEPLRGELARFLGFVVGIRNIPGVIDSKNIRELTTIAPTDLRVDPASRAAVTAFRTWLAVSDDQVLIQPATRQVYSIDHTYAFSGLPDPEVTRVVHPAIIGVSDAVGRKLQDIEPAVQRIEQLSTSDIIDSTVMVPDGGAWDCDPARRHSIQTGRRGIRRAAARQSDGVGTQMSSYYSILRWREDIGHGDHKNLGVMVINEVLGYSAFKAAPPADIFGPGPKSEFLMSLLKGAELVSTKTPGP